MGKIRFLGLFVIMATISFVLGCTTLSKVGDNKDIDQLMSELQVGDKVEIMTKDGRLHYITILNLSPESIQADDGEIGVADIVSVKKEKISLLGETNLSWKAQAGLGILILVLIGGIL